MRNLVYMIFLIPVALWALSGGIHWGSSLILTLLSIVMFFGVVWCDLRRRRMPLGRDMSWLAPYRGIGLVGIGLVASMVLTVLSVVPLSASVLGAISPEHAKVYGEAAELLGTGDGWGYLTASLGRTYYALWHLCGFFAIYFIGLRLGESHRFVKWFSRSIVIVGCIWGIWLIFSRIGVDVSLGAGGATAFMRLGLGINENHVSGVFVLLSLAALGGILTTRHKDVWLRRGIWMSFYALFGVCLVLLQSRGALFAWLCAHIVLAAILWCRSRGAQKLATAAVLISVCVVIGLATIVSASSIGAIKGEIEETSLSFETSEPYHVGLQSKTQIYGDVANMVRDWPMGVGRSAFGDVYPAYQSFWFSKRLRHAENEYYEWIVEYGVVFGILLIALFAAAFIRWGRVYLRASKEQALVVGLLCGLFGIALQSVFDFGVRYWTVGFIFFATAGVVEARMNRWRYGKVGALDGETMQSLSQSSQTLERISRELPASRDKVASNRAMAWLKSHRESVAVCGLGGVLCVAFVPCLFHIGAAVEGQTGLYLERTAEALGGVKDGAERVAQSLRVAVCSDGVRTVVGRSIVRRSERLEAPKRKAQWEVARRWFESAIERAPHEQVPRLALGKVCEGLGDFDCAAKSYLTVAQENPKAASLAMGEYVYLPESVQVMPETWTAQKAFVRELLKLGKYGNVESHISEIEDNKKRLKLAFDLYMSLGEVDIIESIIEQLSSSYFDDFEVYKMKADLYILKKQYIEMISFMDAGRKKFEDNPMYWRYYLHCVVWYGMALGRDAYREKVDALLLEVYRYRKSSTAWQIAYDLSQAKYALELGNDAQAAHWARKVLEKNRHHREAKRIVEKAESGKK